MQGSCRYLVGVGVGVGVGVRVRARARARARVRVRARARVRVRVRIGVRGRIGVRVHLQPSGGEVALQRGEGPVAHAVTDDLVRVRDTNLGLDHTPPALPRPGSRRAG